MLHVLSFLFIIESDDASEVLELVGDQGVGVGVGKGCGKVKVGIVRSSSTGSI